MKSGVYTQVTVYLFHSYSSDPVPVTFKRYTNRTQEVPEGDPHLVHKDTRQELNVCFPKLVSIFLDPIRHCFLLEIFLLLNMKQNIRVVSIALAAPHLLAWSEDSTSAGKVGAEYSL
jgi:hypothetical protein